MARKDIAPVLYRSVLLQKSPILKGAFRTVSSSSELEEPIPLPDGRKLVTLRDAGDYITKLPKADHTAAEWQAAMEALILVADLRRR